VFDIFRSSAAADRVVAAARFIDGFPGATEVLILGASREAADDLARRLAAARGATFGLHRASLTQLAVRCATADLATRGAAPATRLGAEALAARVTFGALRDDAVPYFAPVARFPGFAGALGATLAELRLARADTDALGKAGGAGRDITELLARFDAQLDDAKLADRPALLRLATQALADGGLESLRRMPMLLLDVPIADPVTAEFVDVLTAASPAVLMTVVEGDDVTHAAVKDLAALRNATPAAMETADGRDDSDLARARTWLFAPAVPSPRDRHGDVALFSAPGEARETVEIARRILEEAKAGIPFDEIAVLLRAPDVYAALLQTALDRAGIPAYAARGSARPDPAGRALLALLDCALENLSAKRFAEYLSLGQVPSLDPSGAPPADRVVWTGPEDEDLGPAVQAAADVDGASAEPPPPPADADDQPVVEGALRAPWKWEQLLVESAVIGGADRWARRLSGLDAQFRTKLAEERDQDSPRAAAIARDLTNLDHLRRFALPIIARLAGLPANGTWGEWIAALERLAPMVLRRPERVLTVLASLRPLDVIGPVSLAEVREVLAGELTTLAVRPPSDRYGRVFVGTIEQARGRAFDVVFLPGLAERIFPQKPREDPLLLDEIRRRLGAPLATQEDRGRRERLLLRLAVGAARRRLHLSYSRIEQTEARPRVPSFYALEMERAITGRVPEPQTMERAAADAAGAGLAWPAPDDPARAIDAVEHDLATLRRLLASGRAHGRARYLFELNQGLMRSLRSQWARWQQPRFTPYDGLVRVADGTRDTLGSSRLSARAYSASALQKFAACPYQFFLSAILRLAPREDVEPVIELDPATRGHLFHRVQADFMRALAEAGRLPLDPAALDAARAMLDETLDRVAAEYRERLAPAITRVWEDEIASMRADLSMWLAISAEGHATWEPIAFELAFGLPRSPANDPRSVEAEVTLADGSRVRGIVDLVERRRGGTELRVTDYKTGGNWTKRNLVVGAGEQLQPVLYALAMEQVLGAKVTESRLFYCTRVGAFTEAVVSLTGDARARGLEVLGVVDRAIAAGFLVPAPRRRACGICDFRAVCGPNEETRVTKKDASRLAALEELRGWP
jgi:RecB family exonuclease